MRQAWRNLLLLRARSTTNVGLDTGSLCPSCSKGKGAVLNCRGKVVHGVLHGRLVIVVWEGIVSADFEEVFMESFDFVHFLIMEGRRYWTVYSLRLGR